MNEQLKLKFYILNKISVVVRERTESEQRTFPAKTLPLLVNEVP